MNLLLPKRKIKIAYNPQTNEYVLRLNDLEYTCDKQSVKNWYAIESYFLYVQRKGEKEISDQKLAIIKTQAINRYNDWKKAYPKKLFPNEKFNPF